MNSEVTKSGGAHGNSGSPESGDDQKLLPLRGATPVVVGRAPKSPNSSMRSRSRYRAGPVRKIRRRAVLKNGECNVLQSRISRRSLRFLQDIFTTLVDTQWRWTLLCFALSFLLSWLGFAVIWWLIAFTHGDFDEKHLPPVQIKNDWTPCIYNIFSFTSCFLFSIETQHTIGYGSRSTTEECPEAIFVMCIQSIAGVMIQALMVGIVFAKMSRPKQRTQTLLFSRNAVICQRDGELCLMFRVADMRKSHIIGAAIRAQVIKTRMTKEGETLAQHQHELAVGTDGENGNLFFIWPTTIIHKINPESPFYNMSAEDMLTERFEVVVILEGTIESTGQTTQARSSYLPQEILWGHRFETMVCYSKERQGYEVDHSLFNSTVQVDTPLCSGRELAEFYRVQDDLRHGTGFLVDEDGLLLDPYHEVSHHHYPQAGHHRPAAVPGAINRAESTKSDNSLDEHMLSRSVYREPQSGLSNPQNQRELAHYKIVEVDPDAIQVIGDAELQHLPEAVNREILKNSREIVYEEDERGDHEGARDDQFSPAPRTTTCPRRNNLRHPLPDEEKRSLSGSRRNLTRGVAAASAEEERRPFNDSKRNLSNRNLILIEDDKANPANDSRRNLNGSKRYLLVALDRTDGWIGSAKNLHVGSRENLFGGSRRHTGSRERLNLIRRNLSTSKASKDTGELRPRRRHRDTNPEILNTTHVEIEMEKKSRRISDVAESLETNLEDERLRKESTISSTSRAATSSPSDFATRSTNNETVTTPESGFAEISSNQSSSSPEIVRKEPTLPINSNVTRNRRSYEHAQLQDVNEALTTSSDSDGDSSDSESAAGKESRTKMSPLQKIGDANSHPKNTVSYTSV
ncbi:uncharacterized protein [Venturia canescens]|uniref:uncharacterized protein isoform X2 n=1 Tax=Venturia canescens TaxID=32260 RepID=UPI001C9C1D33|nr:uncharacterized protein LOC122413642 isoform X2 [Venturia canescens]XP_043280059.1 uncharacterized protein LOC122413642 isoform X2 [Venturia canescens]